MNNLPDQKSSQAHRSPRLVLIRGLPAEQHQRLVELAKELRTSINSLCLAAVANLLQKYDVKDNSRTD